MLSGTGDQKEATAGWSLQILTATSKIRQLLQDSELPTGMENRILGRLIRGANSSANEAKHHQYTTRDYAMSRYMYIDAYGRAHHKKNFQDTPDHWTHDVVQDFELALENESDLQQLLAELTPEQRKRTKLFYLEGYSYTEIAEMQGVSPTAVRSSINRGFEVIRKKFKTPFKNDVFPAYQSERENKKSPSQKEVKP